MTSNKTPTTVTASPVEEWEDVDIYWSNDELDDFTTVYALPKVKRHSDATTLNHDVSFTPYEPNKVNNQGVKDVDQLLEEQKNNLDRVIAQSKKDTFEVVCIDASEAASPMEYKQYCSMDNQKAVANRETGKQIKLKRVGLIADAVTQTIICKVSLKQPPKTAKDLPNITTWAFLQPPTIGSNKRRVNANNGYVVDDAQKSGWFLGKIGNDTAQANGTNQYTAELSLERNALFEKSGKTSRKKVTESLPVHIKVDGNDVLYKFTVTVRNDESEEDYKNKREMLLKKATKHDVLTLECGSYIKIWARNSDFSWRDTGPIDEYSEKLREDMDAVDPWTDTNVPQSARNHTWKRNPIVSGEKEGELIYIGLYPTTLIKKINKLEEIIHPIQPDPKKTNFAIWFAVTVVYSLLAYNLNKAKHASAKKAKAKGSSKSESELVNQYGQQYFKILSALNVPQICAAYAVAGFGQGTDFGKTLAEIKNAEYETLNEITAYIYSQVLEFALGKDEEGEKKHVEAIKEENNLIRARHLNTALGATTAERLKAHTETSGNLKKSLTDLVKSAKADSSGSKKGSLSLDAVSLKAAKTLPPIPQPLPIPFLSFIAWYILFKLEGSLNIGVEGEYCQKAADAVKNTPEEDIAKLKLSLTGNSSASMTFNLQAVWTAMLDHAENGISTKNAKSPLEDYYWGKIIKDIFELAELQLYIGAKITTELTGETEFSYDFTKGPGESFGCTPGAKGSLGFKAPVGAQLSVFTWSYDLAEAKVFELSNKQISLFHYMRWLENISTDDPVVIRWGDGQTAENCYLEKTSGLFAFGEPIKVYLPFFGLKDPKFTGAIGFRDAITKAGADDEVNLITFKDSDITFGKKNKKIGEEDFTDEAVITGRILIHADDEKPGDFVISKKGSESKIFLDYLSEKSQVALDHIHIDEDGGAANLLIESQKAFINLPELSRLSVVQKPSKTQHTIRFAMQFYHFSDVYIWVRVAEREATWDRSFKYKLATTGQYREWNLVKLRKDGSQYTLDIDLNRIEGLKDESTWDETNSQLQFYLEFAFYADNAGREYLIKQDTQAIAYALVDGDTIDSLK